MSLYGTLPHITESDATIDEATPYEECQSALAILSDSQEDLDYEPIIERFNQNFQRLTKKEKLQLPAGITPGDCAFIVENLLPFEATPSFTKTLWQICTGKPQPSQKEKSTLICSGIDDLLKLAAHSATDEDVRLHFLEKITMMLATPIDGLQETIIFFLLANPTLTEALDQSLEAVDSLDVSAKFSLLYALSAQVHALMPAHHLNVSLLKILHHKDSATVLFEMNELFREQETVKTAFIGLLSADKGLRRILGARLWPIDCISLYPELTQVYAASTLMDTLHLPATLFPTGVSLTKIVDYLNENLPRHALLRKSFTELYAENEIIRKALQPGATPSHYSSTHVFATNRASAPRLDALPASPFYDV